MSYIEIPGASNGSPFTTPPTLQLLFLSTVFCLTSFLVLLYIRTNVCALLMPREANQCDFLSLFSSVLLKNSVASYVTALLTFLCLFLKLLCIFSYIRIAFTELILNYITTV
jgi:hypothetical protein